MLSNFVLKNIVEESRLIKRRIYIAAALILVFILFIFLRLFYLEVVQHEHYITLSKNNRIKVLPIPPIRGLIYSRDEVLLAENQPAFSLEIVPERVGNLDQVISQLARIISIQGEDKRRFYKLVKERRPYDSVPLRYNLDENEVASFSVNKHRFPGVDVAARLYRRYPLQDLTAHVVGYVGRIDEDDLAQVDQSDYLGTTHIGKLGIEKAYEAILHGHVGHQQVEINAQGRIVRRDLPGSASPEPGKNIYLTLDVSLQKVAAEALQGRRGAIVAIDPNNGDVLALVSSPAYDPNLFVNGIDVKSYNELLRSSDTPLVNRVLQGKYPPGSTIKPFLATAALYYGTRTPDDETWCPGWYTLKGSDHLYRDWKKGGHGHVNLQYAIMQSCDVYFYSLANDLGINHLHDGLSDFGFGERTGIDIGGESAGLVPSVEWKRKTYHQPWYAGETLIAGIGQGMLLATPMQLVTAVAALANHGRVIPPQLAYAQKDIITGAVSILNHKPSRRVGMYNPSYWKIITDAMVAVVHGEFGTARRSGLNAPYRFAGKTGTAQVIGVAQNEVYKKENTPEELQDHALFIAFAPAEAPQIAVAIIVENGGSGSGSAAPIARLLFDHFLLKQSSG
jgi:penicillin-binding protein 2